MIMFRSFRFQVVLRVLTISLFVILIILLIWYAKYVSAFIILTLLAYQISSLITFVEGTNRKLARFIESIEYDDFSPGFEADSHLGKSFKHLNDSLRGILEVFKETRKEREENLQLLDTLVKYANVGLMAYDDQDNVNFINPKLCALLEIPTVKTIAELSSYQPELPNALSQLQSGQNYLLRLDERRYLAINLSEIKIQGHLMRLVSIQNIQSELQQKELEAWQNLTKVLRHEIMNSVTPISSLIATLNQIFEEELKDHSPEEPIGEELIDDIREALQAIQNRSQALQNFVSAYRSFTQIPKPEFAEVNVQAMLSQIETLLKGDIAKKGIKLLIQPRSKNLHVKADQSLIEMVIINLIKNASEALRGKEGDQIMVYVEDDDRVTIFVEDNGPGIIPEAIEQIFIPFYSTKSTGSGIGLSLSRQIMQKHFGQLEVESIPDQKTVFKLRF